MHFQEPGPDLTPQEVVRIQLEALKFGDDEGIAIAYDFASPMNKTLTGPLERFTRMLKNPLYHPMINYKVVYYQAMQVIDHQAEQQVTLITLDDTQVVYVFTLSRQDKPPCKNWWMTDGVMRMF